MIFPATNKFICVLRCKIAQGRAIVFQRRKKLANEFSQAEKNHLATVWQELWVLGTWLSKKCPKLAPPTTRIVELRTDYAATTRRLRGEYAKSRIACTQTCAYTYIYIHTFSTYKHRHYTYVDTYAVSLTVVDAVVVLVVIVINSRQVQHICNTYTTNYADYAAKLL